MTSALLIDGENLSSAHAPAILAAVPDDAPIRRVYGDTARLNGWLSVPELRVVHAAPGRNAADILLSIEAVQLACSAGIDRFAIATSDGGLVHLVQHLREAGKSVTVIAEDKATPALRAAAHRFVLLQPPRKPAALPPPPSPDPTPELLDLVVAELHKAGGQGLPLAQINPLAHRELGMKIGAQPEKTWRAWFTADCRKARFAVDPKGPAARVRLASPVAR